MDVANLANNHGFDQGPDALLDSIRNLQRADIVPIGAGASQEEADAPAYVEVKGWTIGLVGVGEVTDPDSQVAVGDEIGTSVGHDFGRALRAIREAEANADLVLVVIHWAVELDTQPRDYQVDEAHRMVDAGADVIFGHHAHRLQPMDTVAGKPIFYGSGTSSGRGSPPRAPRPPWPRSWSGRTARSRVASCPPRSRRTGTPS